MESVEYSIMYVFPVIDSQKYVHMKNEQIAFYQYICEKFSTNYKLILM